MTPTVSPLGRLVEFTARLADPRHRDLVRGMIAELDAIPDRGERRRFAVGAITAILRLSLSGLRDRGRHARGELDILARAEGALTMNPLTPKVDGREVLRRLVGPLAVTAAVFTAILLANFVSRQLPLLNARGAPTSTIAELLLLSVPFSVAMTIPMSVFVAVCWLFVRLGADGTIAHARHEPGGIRRLLMPVLGAALFLAAVTLVTNTQLVPRSNTRLFSVMSGKESSGFKTDRMMTNGELHKAARQLRQDPGAMGSVRASHMAAAYEMEIHKKHALAMASLFLAMVGAAIGLSFPRGGGWLVVGASCVVLLGYYACLVAGESLGDRLVLSPFAAMWMANAVLLVLTLLLVWRRGLSTAPR